MRLPIYFDYASTSPVDPRVLKKMIRYLTLDGVFGNPSASTHCYGQKAKEAVEAARIQVSELIGASPEEIIFTSGATESINLAIKGIAQAYQKKGNHIITSIIEHKAVLNTCQYLETQGFEITYIHPKHRGIIHVEQIDAVLRANTILLSIAHVNNEIGIIQDIEKFGHLCRKNNVIFHVDAAQSVGKLYIDLSVLPVDLMSFSGHKIYGPKGIGVLYVRRSEHSKIKIATQMHGGAQEYGIRSGTLPVHQIVGMAAACRCAKEEMITEMIHLKKMRDRLWKGLKSIQGVSVNGDLKYGIGTILNINFRYIDGETLIVLLKKDLALSTGAACSSRDVHTSHVLLSLNEYDDTLAYNSIRLSVGRFTTDEEIDYAIHKIVTTVTKLNNVMYLL